MKAGGEVKYVYTIQCNRVIWIKRQRFWTSEDSGTPTILIKVIRGFPRSLQANSEMVYQLRYECFLSHISQFIIHNHKIIRPP
jgi:hypothetical protein